MAYSDKVLDHYENPRNVGSFAKSEAGVGTGMVGAPACGDVMKLQIKVGARRRDRGREVQDVWLRLGDRVVVARHRMGEGQDARRGDDDPQHADRRRARITAGEDPLLDPRRRRDQGRGCRLSREAGRGAQPAGEPRRPPTDIMAITLTESAARHVAANLEKRGKGVGLRLGVRTSGCSGLAYKLEYADDVRPEDAQFESHGVRVIVDPKSLPYLEGTELDFTREGLNEGFKFNNPNVKDACGCGESFNV